MALKLPGYVLFNELSKNNKMVVFQAIREKDQKSVLIKAVTSDHPTLEEIAQLKNEYESSKHFETDRISKPLVLDRHLNTFFLIFDDEGLVPLSKLEATVNLTMSAKLQIAVSAAKALQEVQKQHLIHRDLQPYNLMVDPETYNTKIIGLGFATKYARQMAPPALPDHYEERLSYISPELTGRINREVDYRTDFYSLGVILYELFTGHRPFTTLDPMELIHAHIATLPLSPSKVDPSIPKPLSDIIMKLLSKPVEERYSSAASLIEDLEKCLESYLKTGHIEPFTLGKNDVSASFQISQKLYGRENELKVMFDLVKNLDESPPKICLIKGYSGIGKSSVILELHKPMIERGGFFIIGKFDQFKTDIPYSALIQAFKNLIQYILTETDDKIHYWKHRIKEVLGANAGVITEVIPALKLIIGDPPKPQELDTEQTHNRFSILFQQFITIFASKETPLVIFLDDLQWIDMASLKLIEILMLSHQTQGLLLIGAFRSNEVDSLHPLISLKEKIVAQGGDLTELEILPLTTEHVVELLADTLHHDPKECHELAEVITRKTEGNPYFINQLLSYLHTEKLLSFSSENMGWNWDLEKIQNSKISDNIVTLLIEKLQKCSETTQEILMLASCTGHSFSVQLLIQISCFSPQVIIQHIQEAIQEGFITPVDRLTDFVWELNGDSEEELSLKGRMDTLRFPHDRVQQAAYSLMSPAKQKEEHLKIGRILIADTPPEEFEDKIFDIVYQVNSAETLIRDPEERKKCAGYNLMAGEKAMKSVAYKTALLYLKAGLHFVLGFDTDTYYDLIFPLQLRLAECSFLIGNYKEADDLFNHILTFAKTDAEKVQIYTLKIKLMISTANYKEAIKSGKMALGILGVDLPENTGKLDLLKELFVVKYKLLGHNKNSLLNLPLINDKRKSEIMNILFILIAPTYLSEKDLYAFIILKGVHLSLEWGLSPYASYIFAAYGIILTILFGNLQDIVKYGELAEELLKSIRDPLSLPATRFLIGAYRMPYDQTIHDSIDMLRNSFETGITVGDFIYGVYALAQMMSYQYISSKNLDELQVDLLNYREFVSKVKAHNRGFMFIGAEHAILALKGQTPDPWSMNTPHFSEEEFFQSLIDNNFPLSLFFIYIFKMQILYLFGKYEEMVKIAKKSEAIGYAVRGHPINLERDFYYGLGICSLDKAGQKREHKSLQTVRKIFKKAAKQAPQNFLHKHLLIEAECARIRGKKDEAIELYDRSIEEAKMGGYTQNSAIACELFARFWLAFGKQHLAKNYLIEAHYAYYCWGASAKVHELEKTYPELFSNQAKKSSPILQDKTGSKEGSALTLDLKSILKTSEILSEELEYNSLVHGLMNILTENAGAEKAVLLLEKEGKWSVEAEATNTHCSVALATPLDKASALVPTSAIYYVLRTKETLVLKNASEEGLFASDPYIVSQKILSAMAFPLIHQKKLIGILWLENNLNTDVFTPSRVEILKLLSSQIANSIENAILFTQQANLSKELQISNAKLEDYSQNLERKVYTRTHEINEKNEQLQKTLKQIKEMQKKLVEQEKLVSLGAVTKSIASEMRTPLNYIFNFASISQELLEDLKKGENAGDVLKKLEQNLSKINEHSKKADEIIVSMLDEAREQEPVKELTDLNKLIRDYADLVYYNYYKNDPQFTLSIDTSWDPHLEKIAIIPQNIGRVIYNLVDNACYSMDQKKKELQGSYSPTLTLSTEMLDDAVKVVIRDNGKGIAPDLLPKLFTPYTTTKPSGKGAGMGLSFSYDIIVQENQGSLDIKSELGEWTEVNLTLPRTRDFTI